MSRGPAARLTWLGRRYVVATVDGESMAPLLQPGDRLLVRRVRIGRIRRGQIVVARDPVGVVDGGDAGPIPAWIVKRAVAVPGDQTPTGSTGRGLERVPAGCLYLLGDNAAHSRDSRVHGCFSEDDVLGVVALRIGAARTALPRP